MSGFGRRHRALETPPALDRRLGRQPALQDLVPADEPALLGHEKPLDALDEIALELGLVLQPLGLDPGLTLGAGLPAVLRTFVAADVDVGGGKEVRHLGQHALQDLEGLLVPGAVDVGVDAPVVLHFERAAGAGQLGVRGQGGHRVPGHLDLGNDHHVTALGVAHDLPDVVLGIESAVNDAVLGLAPGALPGELGVFLDLDSPALVLGQMPVEAVHLEFRQQVDVPLDEILGHEMPAAVEVQPPPGKAGDILDLDAGQSDRGRKGSRHGRFRGGRRQELPDGLNAVKDPLKGLRPQQDSGGLDAQGVAFRAERPRGSLGGQDDPPFPIVGIPRPLGHGQDQPRGLPDELGQILSEAAGFLAAVHQDPRRRGEGKDRGRDPHRGRLGDDRGRRPRGRRRSVRFASQKADGEDQHEYHENHNEKGRGNFHGRTRFHLIMNPIL